MQTYHIQIDEHQQETTVHGAFDFPLAIYTTQISKNILGLIDWHWHEELQFCIVTTGKVVFHVNGEILILDEGAGIFINKNQLHKAMNAETYDSSYICIDFHEHLISGFMGSILQAKYVSPFLNHESLPYCTFESKTKWQLEILSSLITLYNTYEKRDFGYELLIVSQLHFIWHQLVIHGLMKNSSDQASTNTRFDFKPILDMIHQHYMDPIELADLARAANLSKSAFCRKFKKHMSCTASEYMINYRLQKASEKLRTTEDSISEIAYACGFGSTSYFIERFKLKTKTSPLQFRKSL